MQDVFHFSCLHGGFDAWRMAFVRLEGFFDTWKAFLSLEGLWDVAFTRASGAGTQDAGRCKLEETDPFCRRWSALRVLRYVGDTSFS